MLVFRSVPKRKTRDGPGEREKGGIPSPERQDPLALRPSRHALETPFNSAGRRIQIANLLEKVDGRGKEGETGNGRRHFAARK